MASRALPAALLPIVVKALVSVALLAWGFVAVSDDDFARIVIAESFAESPSLDPSGTSWLPVPFWIYGTTFAAFGQSLTVGRAVAFLLGVSAIGLVYVSARWLGASARAASLGATLSAVLPHSAWLGVAMVPELPTAALTLLGIAGACSVDPKRTFIGAVALGAATLSRYEAWPVAAAFSALVGIEALRKGQPLRMIVAAIASGGIMAWILHGVFIHGDALFFLHRVSSYKAALGADRGRALLDPLRPLFALLVAEPELTVVWALGALGLRWTGAHEAISWKRPVLMAAALVLFLCVGWALGGAPTHHPSRPLVTVWLLGAIVAGVGLQAGGRPLAARWKEPGGLAFMGAALTLVLVSRLHFPRDSFSPRTDERAIGEMARTAVPTDGRLLVDTPDYGYFAVIAAFGSPSRAVILREHDPRAADDEEHDLIEAAVDHRAGWVVAPGDALPAELAAAGEAGDLVLVALPKAP